MSVSDWSVIAARSSSLLLDEVMDVVGQCGQSAYDVISHCAVESRDQVGNSAALSVL